MTTINGNGITRTIRDTRGDDTYRVNGSRNNIRFHGDRDANTFIIDGTLNTISIDNLGRDDRVILEGPRSDWEIDTEGPRRDGVVRLRNKNTGNEVTVATDGGRNDRFVLNRLQFSGSYSDTIGSNMPQEIIRDRRGTTGNVVDGHARNVKFVGDHGANSFRIWGTHNHVEVTELGRDDSVELEGPAEDWQVTRGRNDGTIRYYNSRTKNTVVVSTDGGRGDNHVADRVRFSGSYHSVSPTPPRIDLPDFPDFPNPEVPQLPWNPPVRPLPMPWPDVGCPCHYPVPPIMPPMAQDPFMFGLLLGFIESVTMPGSIWGQNPWG